MRLSRRHRQMGQPPQQVPPSPATEAVSRPSTSDGYPTPQRR